MGYLLAALVGGFFLFNSQATPQRAERAIEKVLAQRFPGATIDAEIEGKKGRDVLKGRFRRVKLSLANFELEGSGLGVQVVPNVKSEGRVGRFELSLRDFSYSGLKVGSLEMGFDDATFDWKALKNHSQLKVARCGPGQAALSLASSSLEPLLKTRLKDVQNMKLAVMPNNRVRLSGTRPAPLINTPIGFEVSGRLEVRRGREIWLADPRAEMGGVPLTAPLARAVVGSLNPVYQFDAEGKAPFAINITELKTDRNTVELKADMTLKPAAP